MDVFGFLLYHSSWVVAIVGLVTAAYLYLSHMYSDLEKRKVPHLKPSPFIGNMGPIFFNKTSFSEFIPEFYGLFKGKRFVGFYQFTKTAIMLRDPELIKKICVKDFDSFVDRNFALNEDVCTLFNRNLFALHGEVWREMRNTLSPAFTSSKMKAMLSLVDDCGQNMKQYLEKKVREHKPDAPGEPLVVEAKDLFTKYTNDVIASCAFGIECDSFANPDNEFYLTGKDSTNLTRVRSFIIFCYMICSGLMKFLRISVFSKRTSTFFRFIISETVQQREREGIVRPDMIHLLMQARKGELKSEASDEVENTVHRKAKSIELDDETIAAQAFFFFLGGFDTSATLLCFATLLLAMHPEIQERVQEEIDGTLTGNSPTYQMIQDMKYLDSVLSEALRMYPPVPIYDRVCVQDYLIPATESSPELTIRKGEGVWIPCAALHSDPEYFPDPKKFDPERFSNENKRNIQPYTYLPFGVGPRNCIGSRFALMEAKIAMVHLLSDFSVHVVPKTELPITLAKGTFNVTIEKGFWVGIKPRIK